MLKRFSIVLVLTVALLAAFAGSAYANFGPHGGYTADTDSCAGCHRAHTSFSTVGWTDVGGNPHASALLVGNAATMTEFCEACHGDTAPGASTNVASGVFDSGPSAAPPTVLGANSPNLGASSVAPSGTAELSAYPGDGGAITSTQYKTASTFGAPLNGGGFIRMPDPYAWQTNSTLAYAKATSAHKMDVSGPLWGSGNAGVTNATFGGTIGMTCTDCHDPHGTSNYRLLKAKPNPDSAGIVGGYDAVNMPNAYVFSDEPGYPVPLGLPFYGQGTPDAANPAGGWLKGPAGAIQMANYRPNYTDTTGTPLLHVAGPNTQAADYKSMSAWCANCHTKYNAIAASVGTADNYNPFMPYNGATPQVGTQSFHRHAVDAQMGGNATFNPVTGTNGALTEAVVESSSWVPLEQNTANNGLGTNWASNYIGCLTCHRAHGSSVTMAGWSAAHLETMSVNTTGTPHTIYAPVRDTTMGVEPSKVASGSSALLRANNRGVCERCHNK